MSPFVTVFFTWGLPLVWMSSLWCIDSQMHLIWHLAHWLIHYLGDTSNGMQLYGILDWPASAEMEYNFVGCILCWPLPTDWHPPQVVGQTKAIHSIQCVCISLHLQLIIALRVELFVMHCIPLHRNNTRVLHFWPFVVLQSGSEPSEWRAPQVAASWWLHSQKYLHPNPSQYLSQYLLPLNIY